MTAEFRYLPCMLRSHPVTSNSFLEFRDMLMVANRTFLASRTRALPRIAHHPEMNDRPTSSIAFWLPAETMPASATTVTPGSL